MTPRWYRVVAGVVAALFVVCVVLQGNDPDPLRWMAIYGAAALAAAALPAARTQPWASIAALVVAATAAVWAATIVPRVWGVMAVTDLTEHMMMKGGAIEEARELGGLAIVALALAALAVARRRWRVSPRP